MENNTLTAKEWLKDREIGYKGVAFEIIMEQYASYRTKELEAVYDEYIKLLSEELGKFANLQISHPHLVPNYNENSEPVKKGKELREKIQKLKSF